MVIQLLTCGAHQLLKVGVEVAEGGGEGEWGVCEDDFGREAGNR